MQWEILYFGEGYGFQSHLGFVFNCYLWICFLLLLRAFLAAQKVFYKWQ